MKVKNKRIILRPWIPENMRVRGIKTRDQLIEYYGFTDDEIYGEVCDEENIS